MQEKGLSSVLVVGLVAILLISLYVVYFGFLQNSLQTQENKNKSTSVEVPTKTQVKTSQEVTKEARQISKGMTGEKRFNVQTCRKSENNFEVILQNLGSLDLQKGFRIFCLSGDDSVLKVEDFNDAYLQVGAVMTLHPKCPKNTEKVEVKSWDLYFAGIKKECR